MMDEPYMLAIVALLPLTACMLVVQSNPYHALVIRGILGAVAALVYALFGAADVALTEALVGTMLAITLYAVAVRSSLCIRLGILEHSSDLLAAPKSETSEESPTLEEQLRVSLHKAVSKYHMRLEWVTYGDRQTLEAALIEREIHATVMPPEQYTDSPTADSPMMNESPPYQIQTRIERLFKVMQATLPSTVASLTYIDTVIDKSAPQSVDKKIADLRKEMP